MNFTAGRPGWFADSDLVFGPEIETVRCGYPSHSEEDCDGYYLIEVLNDVDPTELMDTYCSIWLIGNLPDGSWLVQLNVDTVCTAPKDAFRDVGPATELWEKFEANYEHYEQEMMEWAEEEDNGWENDVE